MNINIIVGNYINVTHKLCKSINSYVSTDAGYEAMIENYEKE